MKTKMCRYVGILYRIKFHVPLKVRLLMYHSFVQSHLNYCCLVWGFACKSSIDSVFTKQKKAMRAIMPGFVRYYYKNGELPTGTKTSFSEYKILTVHGIIAKSTILFMNKYHYQPDNLPKSVSDLIDNDAPKYCLDETDDPAQRWFAKHNTSIYRNSLFFSGPMIYTDPELKNLVRPNPGISNFKNMVKNILLKFEHREDPEKWEDSKFFIHEIQGIRKSKRIGAT